MTAQNQDDVMKYILLKEYERLGSWMAVTELHGQDWDKIAIAETKDKKTGEIIKALFAVSYNFTLILKVIVLLLIFMVIGDKVHKSIMKTFNGKGFSLHIDDD